MVKIFALFVLVASFTLNIYGYNYDDKQKALSGECDLLCANLEGADLKGISIRFAHLQVSKLMSANLSGAYLPHAFLWNANMTSANLTNANFRMSSLWDADLTNAILTNANFVKSSFRNANLTNADLTNANLEEANFKGAILDGATVKGANFNLARGLTNEQKKYLVKNSAINVPPQIICEVEDQENLNVGFESKEKANLLKRMYRRIFIKKKTISTQTK